MITINQSSALDLISVAPADAIANDELISVDTDDFSQLVGAALVGEDVDEGTLLSLEKGLAEETQLALFSKKDHEELKLTELTLNLEIDSEFGGEKLAANFIISLQKETLISETNIDNEDTELDTQLISTITAEDHDKDDDRFNSEIIIKEDILESEGEGVIDFIRDELLVKIDSTLSENSEKAPELFALGSEKVTKLEGPDLAKDVAVEEEIKLVKAEQLSIANLQQNKKQTSAQLENTVLPELSKKAVMSALDHAREFHIDDELAEEKLTYFSELIKTEILPKRSELLMTVPKNSESYINTQLLANTQLNITGITVQQERIQVSATQHFEQPIPLMDEAELAPALGQRVQMMLNRQLNHATIALDPPELGPLMIKLQVDANQKTHLMFTVHSDAVRDIIEQQLPKLKEMFEGQGLQLGDANVSSQDAFSQDQEFDNNKRESTDSNQDYDESEIDFSERQYAVTSSGVDLFA